MEKLLPDSLEALLKTLAADDRRWSTQETVEYNLRSLAQHITRARIAEQIKDFHDINVLLNEAVGRENVLKAQLEKDRPSLKELLAQITPENRHELLWGGQKYRPEVVRGLVTAVEESIMEMKRHGVCCRKYLEEALAAFRCG